METTELIFIVASILSAFMSFMVLMTGLVFGNMRNRPFMQIILNIAACDTVACIASAFGFPNDRTALCSMQSFLAVAGFKSSWWWIVMLCHQMYNYVSYGVFGLRRYQMHLVVWTISIGTTLLPLVQTRYGRDDDTGWCFLTDGVADSTVTAVWSSITFNCVLLGALLVMLYYNVLLYWNYSTIVDYKVIAVFKSLYLYPVGMICIWAPNLIVSALLNWNAIQYSDDDINKTFLSIVFFLGTQNGTITAIIFFSMSREARLRWAKLVTKGLASLYIYFVQLCCCCNESYQRQSTASFAEKSEEILVFYAAEGDVDESVYEKTRQQSLADRLNSSSASYEGLSLHEDLETDLLAGDRLFENRGSAEDNITTIIERDSDEKDYYEVLEGTTGSGKPPPHPRKSTRGASNHSSDASSNSNSFSNCGSLQNNDFFTPLANPPRLHSGTGSPLYPAVPGSTGNPNSNPSNSQWQAASTGVHSSHNSASSLHQAALLAAASAAAGGSSRGESFTSSSPHSPSHRHAHCEG